MLTLKGFLLALTLFTYSATTLGHIETLRIGVLSKRGPEITLERWSELAVYLSHKLDRFHFVIVPLGFEQIKPAIEERTIDLLLTNPGMFIDISFSHNIYAIATLKRKLLGEGYTRFGSVVFTQSGRTEITRLEDVQNQRVAAVNENSLGGWIAAYREFDSLDITTNSFASLDFLGTHDAVVYAVRDGKADIGIVRTDTLERMDSEGRINQAKFKVLPAPKRTGIDHHQESFPLSVSSRLYPEWPLIGLAHLPATIAEKVLSALLSMSPESNAAMKAQIMGWTIPKNYREIDLTYSQLKIGTYKELTDYSLTDVIERYWKSFLTLLFFISLLAVVSLYISSLNRKLKSSQQKLEQAATHDSLTGLPNRSLFATVANKYLHIANREKRIAVVMFLDLDRFKLVNDSYGHDVGDALLKDVSQRITSVLRNNDIVARIGGDEFLIMLWNVASAAKAEEVMQRLIDSISLPMLTDNSERIEIGCSIGASSFPKDAKRLEELIKKADISLYDAKNRGRGLYVCYSDDPVIDKIVPTQTSKFPTQLSAL